MVGQACEVESQGDVLLSDEMEPASVVPPVDIPEAILLPIPISVPGNDYAMAAKQYLIPVIFKTADAMVPIDGERIEEMLSLYETSKTDWNMGAWSNDEYDFVRASANLTAGLRHVQEKYRRMFMPVDAVSVDQGTFDIASWAYSGSDLDGTGIVFSRNAPTSQLIRPLVVEGRRVWSNPTATTEAQKGYYEFVTDGDDTTNFDNFVLGEVYDALGCSRYNCPFVPLMFVAAPAATKTHAIRNGQDICYNNTITLMGGGDSWNRGYNHGGGAIRMNYYSAINDNWTQVGKDANHLFNQNKFLSTLVHEIGHFSGVGDLNSYNKDRVLLYHNYYTAPSIMNYNEKNHHGNCWGIFDPVTTFCRLDPDYASEGAVRYSNANYTDWDTAAIDRYSGVLAPRERLAWGYQNRIMDKLVVDPEIDYACSLYADPNNPSNGQNQTTCESRGRMIGVQNTDRTVIGHGKTTITSANTSSGNLDNLFGASAFWFASSDVTFSSSTMWRSKAGATAQLCINFPTELESAELGKIMVLTGTRSTSSTTTINKATNMTVSTLNPTSTPTITRTTSTQSGSFIATITSTSAAHTWCVNLTSPGSTSLIDVRGIRLFLKDGTEFYGPSEASILESYTQPTTGSNQNLVGTSRTIVNKTATSLNASTMWRAPTNSLSWTSVTVEFPEQVQLSKILVYTGYKATSSAITDVARQVQLGRRDESGTWVSFLNHVDSPLSKKTMNIPAAHQRAKLWKIMFKSSSPGNVVVRGMRFFDVNGKELFEPFVYPSAE
jgi:hypothetical protein